VIRYALACSEGHEFEGWFRSSEAFDRQAEANELRCPACGETRIGKLPMAPHVARRPEANPNAHERRKTYTMLREIRDKLTENSEYVGARFPEEARKIHYEECRRAASMVRPASKKPAISRRRGFRFGPCLGFPRAAIDLSASFSAVRPGKLIVGNCPAAAQLR
jgi:hypothetical protein